MRLLLDTHVALWAITNHPRLADKARGLIADPDNHVYVSAATIWEISIKHALARGAPGDMPISGGEARRYFEQAGYLMLAISAEHAAAVESLPALHADPFDRMLIAQARIEPLRLLTHDAQVADYGEPIIRV